MSKEIEAISLEFNKNQTDLQELITSRQKLETQLQENSIVLNEFDKLETDSKIYKLIGPVLLPQDNSEAKLNVEKRLEFIKNEIARVEKTVVEVQNKLEKSRESLIKLRTSQS